jgi:hypothetical protein
MQNQAKSLFIVGFCRKLLCDFQFHSWKQNAGRFFPPVETYFPESIPFKIFGNFPILLTSHNYLPNKDL